MGAVGRDPLAASPSLETSSCCEGPVNPSVFAMNSSLPLPKFLLLSQLEEPA